MESLKIFRPPDEEAYSILNETLAGLEKKRWRNRSLRLTHGCHPLHEKDKQIPRPGFRNYGFRHYGNGVRFIQYDVQPDARYTEKLFLALCETMPDYCSLVIDRESEDVNRERDSFFRPDTDREYFLEMFNDYKHFWLEDGTMGIGLQTQDEGHEIFLDDHKCIIIFSKGERLERILKIFRDFGLEEWHEDHALHDVWHRHMSFESYLKDDTANELLQLNMPLDGYDFCNELVFSGEFEFGEDICPHSERPEEEKFTDKWHYRVIGETSDGRGFFKVFYLCAPDRDMAETLLDNWISGEPLVENYTIYDSFNLDPDTLEEPEARERMKMASLGICWSPDFEFFPLEEG